MTYIRLSIVGDCRIDVDGVAITPASPHLFAVLLILAGRREGQLSRNDLQKLLFEPNVAPEQASHNLRQLLYRVRRLGIRVDEGSSGLSLADVHVCDPLQETIDLGAPGRARQSPAAYRVLPIYAPRLPKSFAHWVDDFADCLNGQLRSLLLEDLEQARASHSWADALTLCDSLTHIDPCNAVLLRSRAEALAMLGRRRDALAVLDQFLQENTDDDCAVKAARVLRTRIEKSPSLKRVTPLKARATSLAFLDHEWAKATTEGASLSAIVGQAGIGKTRLSEEHAARVSLAGGRVIRYVCDSQSKTQPLSLFSQILAELCSARGSLGASPEHARALARLRTEAQTLTEGCVESTSIEIRRAEIQYALIDLIEAVSAERSLLLLIDDAHYLDEASRSVIRGLVNNSDARAQVLVCLRPSSNNSSLLAATTKTAIHELCPLSAADSRDLVTLLQGGIIPDEEHVTWCVEQSAGNPFFLHALALHRGSTSTSIPFRIQSHAASSYSSLAEASRSVLEACLLLARFATLDRTRAVVGIDNACLLSAFRELEEYGLIEFRQGRLYGPHALIHDALLDLIPTSVAALHHRRIAELLEQECVAEQYDSLLAWSCAQSWLAAGNPVAATRLMRRCASQAAALGEPSAAAGFLLQLLTSAVPSSLKGELLDDIIHYAQVGGAFQISASALRDRLQLAIERGESEGDRKSIQFQVIEADLLNGAPVASTLASLMDLLHDLSAPVSIRTRAGVRLIVIADLNYDAVLANSVYSVLRTIGISDLQQSSHLTRAELVYHVTFGDPARARLLAATLLSAFPEPDVLECATRARTYAAFAYYRMRETSKSRELCEAEYAFMKASGAFQSALYAASLLTEIAITDGDFVSATKWLETENAGYGVVSQRPHSPSLCYCANAAELAMMRGAFDEAERFVAPLAGNSLLSAPRLKAVSLALLIRLQQRRAETKVAGADVALLFDLYQKGCDLGGQDAVVEALWCCEIITGNATGASRLLRDYLANHRRERGRPDWSLRHTTAADDAWVEFIPALPKVVRGSDRRSSDRAYSRAAYAALNSERANSDAAKASHPLPDRLVLG
ncbi:MAG: AAA family ATPase [bacterium]